MVHHDRRGALLGFELELIAQFDAHTGWVDQREELCLILQARTGGITKRIPTTSIMLLEELSDGRRIVSRNSPFMPELLMEVFRQRFRGFDSKPMQIKIILITALVVQIIAIRVTSSPIVTAVKPT